MKQKINNKRINDPRVIRAWLIPAGLFVISVLFRLPGLKHGFPLLTHPDEGVILDMVFFKTKEGFLFPGNLGNFIRPNQILYTLNFVYLNLMSALRFGENFAARYQLYELHFYHYARLLIAMMGSLIPVVAYMIGKLFNRSFALVAGLLFLVFPSYVLHSHYVTPDIPITLFTLVVIYFMLRYLLRNDNAALYGAVFFAAVNTAEKYPGLLSLALIFAGLLIKTLEDSDKPFQQRLWPLVKKSLTVLLLFSLALFLVAPNLFLHFQMVIEGFVHSSRSTHVGADHLDLMGRLIFYVKAFASWSNLLVVFWLLAGCIALIKWRNHAALLFLYGAFYWVCLSVLSLHWERWALPMYITPLFLSALGISFLWEQAKKRPKIRWVLGILIMLFFFQQGIKALYTSISLGYTDTRVLALDYAQSNGITPENSLYEGYTPFQVRQSPKSIFLDYRDLGEATDYILLSSRMYDRYYWVPERFSDEIAVYENIRENHSLLAKFDSDEPAQHIPEQVAEILNYFKRSINLHTLEYTRGPTIEIYQVSD
jgi:hypothetical protein